MPLNRFHNSQHELEVTPPTTTIRSSTPITTRASSACC